MVDRTTALNNTQGTFTLGTLVLVVSAAMLVLGIRARAASWIVASVAGLVGISASLFGGSTFMNGQSDVMSFLMACGLGLAMLAYATGLYAWALGAGGARTSLA